MPTALQMKRPKEIKTGKGKVLDFLVNALVTDPENAIIGQDPISMGIAPAISRMGAYKQARRIIHSRMRGTSGNPKQATSNMAKAIKATPASVLDRIRNITPSNFEDIGKNVHGIHAVVEPRNQPMKIRLPRKHPGVRKTPDGTERLRQSTATRPRQSRIEISGLKESTLPHEFGHEATLRSEEHTSELQSR